MRCSATHPVSGLGGKALVATPAGKTLSGFPSFEDYLAHLFGRHQPRGSCQHAAALAVRQGRTSATAPTPANPFNPVSHSPHRNHR